MFTNKTKFKEALLLLTAVQLQQNIFLCFTNLWMLASGGDAFVKAKSIFVGDFSVAGMLFSLTGATATNQYFLEKCICNLQ